MNHRQPLNSKTPLDLAPSKRKAAEKHLVDLHYESPKKTSSLRTNFIEESDVLARYTKSPFILLDTKRAKICFVIQNCYTISRNWKIFVIHFILNKSLVNKKVDLLGGGGVWAYPLHPPPYGPARGLQGDKGFKEGVTRCYSGLEQEIR